MLNPQKVKGISLFLLEVVMQETEKIIGLQNQRNCKLTKIAITCKVCDFFFFKVEKNCLII